MSRQLGDITIYYYSGTIDEKIFNGIQNMVSDLYIEFLRGYKPPKTSRITISISKEDYVGNYYGSILSASAVFDADTFWLLKENQQFRVILETIHRIALLCADKYGWDKEVFIKAYDEVLAVDFKYEIEGKSKLSNDRQHKASVLVEKDVKCAIISVVFYDKQDDRIKKVELLKSFQHQIFYGGIIKRYKWFSNREFGIYTKDEEIILKASLDNDIPIKIIHPKTKDKEALEGELRRITYKEINTKEDLIKWANQ